MANTKPIGVAYTDQALDGSTIANATITNSPLSFASTTQTTHPIDMTGMTLATNTNAIRGASVNPTRTSGWTSFSGTISTTPTQTYSDFRELHTTGTAEVLGIGTFPFMDSGASCKSMFGLQSICEVDAGATVLSAAGAPAIGIFPVFAKLLLNGETFTSGGVGAALFLSVQANVTDVSAEDVAAINVECASGVIKSLLHQTNTSGGYTNLLWLPDDGVPAKSTQTNGGTQSGWIKVLIGTATRYIRLWDTAPA